MAPPRPILRTNGQCLTISRMRRTFISPKRPVLIGSRRRQNSLWISSRTGRRYTTKNLGTQISKITLETIGVDVSPHLFRTAAATTSACYGTDMPHLASAVLGHTDPRVTEKHYIRATTLNAAKDYAAILRRRRSPGQPDAWEQRFPKPLRGSQRVPSRVCGF